MRVKEDVDRFGVQSPFSRGGNEVGIKIHSSVFYFYADRPHTTSL